MRIKIGHSYDIHQFISGKDLILGGVKIDYPLGLKAHSDGDAVLHVVAEAIIGALGLGDLGTFFPDTDSKYRNMPSSYFVIEACKLLKSKKYIIENIDITIFLEEPNLENYKLQIRNNIANLLNINSIDVNIKATRGEKLGFIGRKEGLAADAVILIKENKTFENLEDISKI